MTLQSLIEEHALFVDEDKTKEDDDFAEFTL
jgi:hypothetical protein